MTNEWNNNGGGGAPPYGGGGYGGFQDEELEGFLPDTEGQVFAAIPPGPYRVTVTDVKARQSSKGGWMWELSLEVADGGPNNGKKLWHYLNFLDAQGAISGAIGTAQAGLKALGLQHLAPQGTREQKIVFRKSDVVGKQAIAIVTVQATGQYAGNNQVDRLESLNAVNAGGPAGGGGGWAPTGAPVDTGGGWGGGSAPAPVAGNDGPPAANGGGGWRPAGGGGGAPTGGPGGWAPAGGSSPAAPF